MNNLATSDVEIPWVRVEHRGPVAWLFLNRPTKYNALSAAMLSALLDALAALAKDPATRVIVLAAEGRAFSAGHDLNEMGADRALDDFRALFARCSELMLAIQRQPQPVIARVQGIATAAGCQLVAMCDLAVASSISIACLRGTLRLSGTEGVAQNSPRLIPETAKRALLLATARSHIATS